MISHPLPLQTGAGAPATARNRRATVNCHAAWRSGLLIFLLAAVLAWAPHAGAFPPAPHHLIYGTVRDQYGTPLMTDQAQVILITPTGVQVKTTVVPGIGFDMNYQLEVPMDAGLTPDPYEPDALIAGANFSMWVVIGQTTNIPIQMTGSFATLGQPAQQSRIDLTLGVDSNGDGIPDAWESAYLSELGLGLNLANVHANSVLGPNGFTVRQEFLAGYYPFDPTDTLALQLLSVSGNSALLQFTGMTGRYYTLLGSSDLQSWVPLSFKVPAEGDAGPVHSYFYAQQVQTIQVQTLQPTAGAQPTLSCGRSANQLSLAWPTNFSGFSVVSSSSLKAPNWQPVPGTPQVVGNNYVLSTTPTGSSQFYRLSLLPIRFFKLVLQE